MGMAMGAMMLTPFTSGAAEGTAAPAPRKQGAKVRAAFLYPPSKRFSDDPDGWWSWPGNEFEAEKRHRDYVAALREMEKKIGLTLAIDDQPVASDRDAQQLIADLEAAKPDGLLLMVFYNNSLPQVNLLLEAADKAGIPTILFIGLGVKHGAITSYRRMGVYFIQSLDNLSAIESGLRMIHAKRTMSQARLLSITEADAVREGVEPFFGTTVRVIPFARYAETFHKVALGAEARQFISRFTDGATEKRGLTQEAFENAARAHLALTTMLREEQADGVAMNCLRRGMLKPCISFSALNSTLIPATCENDLPAAYTQLLGQLLLGRPGFQHNPCYETENNHHYASHCTCATKLAGPDGPDYPFLLRRFAHTNEGSCAIQVFWKPEEPVTMVRYHPGAEPALDVYAGRVVKSHPMPPAAGCTTNVEIEITDREDACMVRGHHNLLFCGDHARKFRLFAQLYRMKLADTGFRGQWPA